MISKEMNAAINTQIANELHSHNAYLAIASYMESLGLKVLGAHFFAQASEERDHALKFLRYLLDIGADVQISSISDVCNEFESVEAAVAGALEQEKRVTGQIHDLMSLAHKEQDFPTISFLKWFVDEQVEEEASMSDLLQLVQRAGSEHLILVEDRLSRSPQPGHE